MLKRLLAREVSLEQKILNIQHGDEELRNKVIEKYTPFIKKSISDVTKRFISSSDEEFSIGLWAFNEAINNFKTDHNASFLSFAKLVIKRRIIDFIRKENSHKESLFIDQDSPDEEAMDNYLIVKTSLEQHNEISIQEKRKEEIIAFQQTLLSFGINFDKLTKVSPKHKDARKSAIEVATLVANTPELNEYLYKHKRLPLSEIEKQVSVSRKTLERNRIYIIAMTIVLSENFIFLQEYLK